MVDSVQPAAPSSSAKSEEATKFSREAPKEENKGARIDDQTGEDRATSTMPPSMEDNQSSAKGPPIEINFRGFR